MKRRKVSKPKKLHPAIKALNGVYKTLRSIGIFFWWSAKFEYLGVKSIAEQIMDLKERMTVKSVVKDDGEDATEIADGSKDVPKSTPKPKKKGSDQPPVFVPWTPITTLKGDFLKFSDRIRNTSTIVLIAGRRGSGKSALGFRLLENINAKANRPSYVLGVRQAVLPNWIDSVEDLEEVHNGGVVLVDEGAISFSSRESMNKKNKELGKLLAVARHKDLTLILITQNTGMIDKNVLNLCDIILLKEGSLLQEKMERGVMKDIYKSADAEFGKLPNDERQKHVYVFDSEFEGVCKVDLPSFWSLKISKNQA
jgi:hypothetical protein